MTKKEIDIFIEEMEEIGDIWTPEQVKDTYGGWSLASALADRKGAVGKFLGIIGTAINQE